MEEGREKEVLIERFNQFIDKVNSYISERKKKRDIGHHFQVQLFIEFVNIATDIYKSSLDEKSQSLLWNKMKETYPVIKELRKSIGGKISPIEQHMIEDHLHGGKPKTIDEIKKPIEKINVVGSFKTRKNYMKYILTLLVAVALITAVLFAGFKIYKEFTENRPPVALQIYELTWNEDEIYQINLNKYFSDKDVLNFSSTALENIEINISETGTVLLTPKKDWHGTEKVIFSATDGKKGADSNEVLLTVLNSPDCGEDGCEYGENCNNCPEDCGACKEEEKEILPREDINRTIVEDGTIKLPEKEEEVKAEDSGRSFILFGMAGGGYGGPTSSKKIGSTSISSEQININPIPCVNITEKHSERIEFNSVNVSEALVPKGYELLMPPFDIKCRGDSMGITVNVPSNYIDVKAMKCKGEKCNPILVKEVEKLKCGNEIVEEYLREEKYLLPEYMPIKITERKLDVSSDNNILESSGNKIRFFGSFENFEASIEMPKKAIPQPNNPSLMITGTPIVLRFDRQVSPSTEITIPYHLDKRIDENTIGIYANKDDISWEYIGGVIDKEKGVVKVDIEDISKYLNEENKVEFALMGLLCISCLESEIKRVYEPEIKTKDAVLLVHGLMSSPATFQDIINDIKITKQPWNAYAYGYPSTKNINENAIDLADHLQARSDEYDNIYIVAHSLGGLIVQQALYYSYEKNKIYGEYDYLNKVRKVILIGVPNKGSPSAEIYKNLFGHLINIKTVYNLFSLNSELLLETISGLTVPRIKGIDYYVIAGIKPYSFNMLLFKLMSKRGFDEYELNDGIVSVTSAQYVGEGYINDKCYNYWEVNVTHTELIDDPAARSLIERIVAKEIIEGIKDSALMGHNKYYDVSINDCSSDDKYIIIGKRIKEEETKDILGCKCGNGYCGEGEDEVSCPSDCAIIKKESVRKVGKYLLGFVIVVLAYISYRRYKKTYIMAIKEYVKKKEEKTKKEGVSKEKEEKSKEEEEKDEGSRIEEKKVAGSVFYSTDFDKLHDFILKKKKIKIQDVAKELGLNKKEVMVWAKILEEHHLIDIKYHILGGIELKKYVKRKKK